jgi:nucleoside-diphosphate-sugar epimerase
MNVVLNNNPINDAVNVSSGKVISVKEIVEIIKKKMNVDIEPIYRDPSLLWENSKQLWEGEYTFSKERMCEEVEKYTIGDTNKVYKIYNWKATNNMDDGIKKILHH